MVRRMVRLGFISVFLVAIAAMLYPIWSIGLKLRAVNRHNQEAYDKYHETHYRAILHCCNNCGFGTPNLAVSQIEIWVPHGETLADQSCPRCKMALNILPDS